VVKKSSSEKLTLLVNIPDQKAAQLSGVAEKPTK